MINNRLYSHSNIDQHTTFTAFRCIFYDLFEVSEFWVKRRSLEGRKSLRFD